MTQEKIKFKASETELIITIPVKLLIHVTENHPEAPATISDNHAFAEAVAFELEDGLGDQDGGNTGFQNLIEAAILAVVEYGHDYTSLKE